VKWRHLLSALALLSCALPLQSATLERLTLEEMIAKSTAIVRGKAAGAHAAFSGRVIYTHYAVQVSESYKGNGSGTLDVAIPGGTAQGLRQTFSGAPELQSGQEYVLFLWTGPAGVTQIIGLTQGLFSVAAGSEKDPPVTRLASRERMLGPAGQPVKDQTLVMRLSELRRRIAGGLAAGRRAR
jgi:hypothetical protein